MTPPKTDVNNAAAKYLPIFGVSLLLGLAFNYLFYMQMPGLQFPVYVTLITAAFFLLAARLKAMPDKSIALFLAPLFFFAIMVYVRAAEFLTFLNLSLTLVFLILIADFVIGLRLRDYFIVDYLKSCILVPLNVLDKLFAALSDIPAVLGSAKERDRTSEIVRGVLLALPVLLIFLLLLSSADLVFHKYVAKIIDIRITPELIFRTMLVVFATAAFTGAFTYLFIRPARAGDDRRGADDRQSLGVIEGSILLGSVDLLFLSFIVVQVAYLFGGKRNIALKGVTYAEYARRGFFELIAVAAISFLLIWLTEKYIFRGEAGHTLNFKLLGSGLILEVLAIMVSAFRRLALYEGAYGYTILRFYSHIFIVWLAVIFALLLIKIFTNEEENAFAFRAFISALAFVAFLNIFNPDAFIARQNIARYKETGKLDVWYLSRLSEDAWPETAAVLDLKDDKLRRDFAYFIYQRWTGLRQFPPGNPWQSGNLAREAGQKTFDRRASFLKANSDRNVPPPPSSID